MGQSVTSTGKSIEQAIENALEILNKSKEEVDIVIKQQPESGVFGFFGRKDAIVEVIEKDEILEKPQVQPSKEEVIENIEETTEELSSDNSNNIIKEKEEKAKKFLKEMFDQMGLDVDIESEYDGEFLRINLSGSKMGILIGRRGQTLDAIQYLTSLAINRDNDEYTRLILDTENYREKRKETLEDLADKMANKAVRFRRRISLEPMNPAERRIIHARLQNNPNVYTYSEGQDPYRRVVIQLDSNR